MNSINNIHFTAEMDEWAVMARLNDYSDKKRIQEEMNNER